MDALFYGIANACEAMFKYLPSVGGIINLIFGILITVGVIYWLKYDSSVRKGSANYMANKGK